MNNDKDIEDLIKIAQEAKSESKQTQLNPLAQEVMSFSNYNKLSHGELLVPCDLIYNNYRIYSKDPTTKIKFFKEFAKHFVKKRTNKTMCYYLNKGAFNLLDDFSVYKTSYVQDQRKYYKPRNGKEKVKKA